MRYRWLIYAMLLSILTSYWIVIGGVRLMFVPVNLFAIWYSVIRFRQEFW